MLDKWSRLDFKEYSSDEVNRAVYDIVIDAVTKAYNIIVSKQHDQPPRRRKYF